MKYHWASLFILFFTVGFSNAQELNCRVKIDSRQLLTFQAAERVIFTELEKDISNFMNNNKWTNDDYQVNERINCDILITLRTSAVQNSFEGFAQVRSTRPVYGTNLETVLLNYNDQTFNFQYVQAQPLIFNINSFVNNLTSILAFYAYVILAMDYDSFSKEGGSRLVEQAYNVANIAQQSGDGGWVRGTETRNRYWLSENLFSQQMLPFRQAIYLYHRQGLDIFLSDPDKARQNILESLKLMRDVNKLKPSAVLNNIYFDAKGSEIVNIFREASPAIRKEVYQLLTTLDPNKATLYEVLNSNQ